VRAVVHCRGYGTRQGTSATTTPKPLLRSAGRSLLEWIIAHLRVHGVREVLLNAHHLPDQIETAADVLRREGSSVRVVHEPELLGTAGTVWRNREWLSTSGPFLVHYGDVVHDGSLRELHEAHIRTSGLITIAVHENSASNSVAHVDRDGRVVQFAERPSPSERARLSEEYSGAAHWAFSGVCIVSPALFAHWPEDARDLPRDLFSRFASRGQLFANPLGGSRVAVDSPARLEQLERLLVEGRCRPGSYD
jgi:mannose-1-phosphate guanylyltransferase